MAAEKRSRREVAETLERLRDEISKERVDPPKDARVLVPPPPDTKEVKVEPGPAPAPAAAPAVAKKPRRVYPTAS